LRDAADTIEQLRGQVEFERECRNGAYAALEKQDAEIEQLQKNFTHAATIAKTAWLTESCGTTGDAEYGSELCQIISDKISAIQQKEKE
jgi:hypothetical protein